jgi:hypothetical protein
VPTVKPKPLHGARFSGKFVIPHHKQQWYSDTVLDAVGLNWEKDEDEQRANCLFRDIAVVMRRFPGLLEFEKEVPRPAHLIEELTMLARNAASADKASVARRIRLLSDGAVAALHEAGLHVGRHADIPDDFAGCVGSAIDQLRMKESRHAPTKVAVRTIIFFLSRVFKAHYTGDKSTPFTNEFQTDNKEFICTVLMAAHIPMPSKPTLRKLLPEVLMLL